MIPGLPLVKLNPQCDDDDSPPGSPPSPQSPTPPLADNAYANGGFAYADDSGGELSISEQGSHPGSPIGSPEPDYDQEGGQCDDDDTPDDASADWEGDNEENTEPTAVPQAGGVTITFDSDDEDDAWELTNDRPMQGGGHGTHWEEDDDVSTDDDTPPGGEDDGEDSGDAGSDVEDMVRLIDAKAARTELAEFHPTIIVPSDAEMEALAKVVRDSTGAIIDENHTETMPWLSRFERASVLGTRATQLSNGAQPQIKVPDGVIDSLAIAEMELEQGQIPFVIRRPLPDGRSEYWPVHELTQVF
jgi:DNA-directed RNA polymerase I, II, and III subunit RPABC2